MLYLALLCVYLWVWGYVIYMHTHLFAAVLIIFICSQYLLK